MYRNGFPKTAVNPSASKEKQNTFMSSGGVPLRVTEVGAGDIDLIWAHGWGQSHLSLIPVAEGLSGARHLFLDFPGFGGTPAPPFAWGTIEYAELTSEWISQLPPRPRIWIGHSFGCRVGIRLASRHPTALNALVLIAAAGIRPPLSVWKRTGRFWRGMLFRILKQIAFSEHARERLRNRWGSSDYRNAGDLRATFVKVVNENLSSDAQKIHAPVQLIYGEKDTETPVIVGKMFSNLIPNSKLNILPRYGHLDILTNGRFQLQASIKSFLQAVIE